MIDVIAAESPHSPIDIYRNAKTSKFDPFFSLHFPAFPHISRAVLLQRPIYPNLVDIRCHLTIVIVEQGKPHHIRCSFSDHCGCCSNTVTAPPLIPCAKAHVMFVCFISLLHERLMYTGDEFGTDVYDTASTPVVSEVRIGMLMPAETTK